MKILIIAEIINQKLSSATLSTISAGLVLSNELDILVLGFNIQAISKMLTEYEGVARVLIIDNHSYEYPLAEEVAAVVTQLKDDYTHILAPATAFSKKTLPRIAALKDVALMSDVVQILSEDSVIHSIDAGKRLEIVQMLDDLKIMTICSRSFKPVNKKEWMSKIEHASIEFLDFGIKQSDDRVKSQVLADSNNRTLKNANIVIAGGRGLQTAEHFNKLERLAEKLHAAVGASRGAVEAGFISIDYQIGQAGKTVAPHLYIAMGISGAIQHIVGIKDARIIVAINRDPNAPIFQIAHYGLVADVYDVLSELEAILD